MKNILLVIALCLCSVISNATTYYIAPNGSNNNPGTITAPFATWDKLSSVMVAGDIAYIRGGTYRSTKGDGGAVHCLFQNLHGSVNDSIKIYAYPGEYPVLNLDNITTTYTDPTAIELLNSEYVHLKGLRITGLKQHTGGHGISRGFHIENANHCTLEFIELDHIGGAGYYLRDGANDNYFLNCDSHHNDDRYSTPDPWGGSDGFSCAGGVSATRNTYEGCRAWWNSDDGWDFFGVNGVATLKNCWSFWNGYQGGTFSAAGDGNGYKLGPDESYITGGSSTVHNTVLRTLTNCVAFENKQNGFTQNVGNMKYKLYNNTSFKNGATGYMWDFVNPAPAQDFRNNVSYMDGQDRRGAETTGSNNTWNGLVTVNSSDFLGSTSTGADGPRGSDGSLPVLNFLHLNTSSDLVNAGINVGLLFLGTAPDMGAFETGGSIINLPPSANAGTDKTITLPTDFVSLTGTGTDIGGSITGYLWTKLSGPAGSIISTPTTATTSITSLAEGVYQFQLRVTDNDGATATDVVQVTVNAASNTAPTANAGANKTITLPANSVSVTGSGTDPDGSVTAYLWTKLSGPAGSIISTPTTATTSITSLVEGVYQFQLRVTDNDGATATDVVQVTVNPAPNNAPTANAGENKTITLPANSVSVTGSGTDPDGSVTAYLWTKLSGPAGSIISTPTTATTSITSLVEGVYQFQLRVTDNDGATATDVIQVTVNPAPNVIPGVNAGADGSITLPTNSINLAGVGTDTDGTIAAYLWTVLSGPAGLTIVTPTSATTSITSLTEGVYQFQLRVTDNDGATATDIVQVTVNPAPNVIPGANAGADESITLPTNSINLAGVGTDTDGTVTDYLWTVLSGPAGSTIVTPTSATTTITSLTEGVYQFQLRVTDNDGATATDIVQVTVNPAPNMIPTAQAGSDQFITLPTNSVSLRGSGTDPDGTITGYQWTVLSGPTGAMITTPADAVTLVTSLVQGIYEFQLQVTDNDGAIDIDTVLVTVNAAPNTPPTANAGADIIITLPTDSVSLTGSGTDPDGTITGYQWTVLSGPAGSIIATPTDTITSVTALLQGVYAFQLQVTDNNGVTVTDTVQVTVNAADTSNVLPTANAGADIIITLPIDSASLTGSGMDPDGSINGYQWTVLSGPSGAIVATPGDSTTFITSMVEGVYTFQLQVNDNKGAIATDTVQVTVNAADTTNILPTANAGADIIITLPTNSTNLTGSGTDTDGTISSYLWAQVSGPSTVTITTDTSASTNITSLQEGIYIFQLTATDNEGATAADTIQVTVNAAPSAEGKVIRVNIFGDTTTYNDIRWNNWKPVANTTSSVFNYEDGTSSTVTAVLSGQFQIHDNGAGYMNTATMCPGEVLRFTSSSWASRTLTFTGLDPDKEYSFEFFASSNELLGYQTSFEINDSSYRINTYYNKNSSALFTDIKPTSDSTVTVTLSSIGIWNYLSAFNIIEQVSKTGRQMASAKANKVIEKKTEKKVVPEKKVIVGYEVVMNVNTFPAPFSTSFTAGLQGGMNGKYNLSVVDMTGTIVWKKSITKNSFSITENVNLSNLPGGMYILVVTTPDQKKTTKQIIKH